ncbi:hypothetical protein, partial [Acinetobacter baumannii]|uniref:hypothetical protein n=1 Tax=Acinetobacter baumannii TaxID=470 RepID=UPI001CB8642C
MLLSLDTYKQQQFDQIAAKIMVEPEKYIDFNSVSDFYNAAWLKDFPQGTQASATGLDDGAEVRQRYRNFNDWDSYSELTPT